jgi:acetoin utilization deacetylase AcuC-like enzyme
LEELARAVGKQGHFDADTFYGPKSVAAARRAAGGAISIVEALREEKASFGMALLRPPGHHARPDSAMGFCLLNNVAVAAAHARASGSERVAIIDWDVHHGNGTQEMFYADPSVLYVSLHQFPFYPGTGSSAEVGADEGRGYTVNVPLSEGADDDVYIAAFDRLICPILNQYDPSLVLISAGFDAHRLDPLASMRLTHQGYAAMLERLMKALPRGARGRLALILEGGYDLEGLGSSLRASVEALDSQRSNGPAEQDLRKAPKPSPIHERDIGRALAAQAQFWRLA